MKPREIKTGVYCVGAIDWDRRLFDSLIPLPDGTSYNSYLVKGSQKTALIDTVDPTKEGILVDHLTELGFPKIDYVISHHAEQDHAGSIPCVLDLYPDAKVVCTVKCKGMLMDLLLIPEEKFITVEDKETISLGDRTLEFIHAPWVHWPETMLTYLREDRILFPCDFFGSHLATTDMYVTDEGQVYEAAKRYYAEIMMPFRNHIQKNLEKVKGYKIDIIAPSHGPMHNKPDFIIKAYNEWAFCEPKNIVVLPYVSMHDSTREMVKYFVEALTQRGVTVKQFDLTVTDIGKLAMSLVDAATVVIGTPTVLAGPHPAAAYAAFLANAIRPNVKFVSIIGSYGWGGKTVETLAGMIPNLKVEVLGPVLAKGFPREADFQALDKLAETIAQKHKETKCAS
ncbi:MAG: FprA family A-type flavoprotein [Chloroflexi bacterium]|nr:FprA family A-type flavoprotein [Chloroflexota bacterium]MBM4453334.1 FprA family A-type flavoprotein [Chloroflexota bacterium]